MKKMIDLKIRLENSKTKIKIGKLESDLGIQQSVLSKWLKGSRELPEKYIASLTEALDKIEDGTYENLAKEKIVTPTEKKIIVKKLNIEEKETKIEEIAPKNEKTPIILNERQIIEKREYSKEDITIVDYFLSMCREFTLLVGTSSSIDNFNILKSKAIASSNLLPTQKSAIVDRVNNYLNGTYKK
jgi:hypothetical protein